MGPSATHKKGKMAASKKVEFKEFKEGHPVDENGTPMILISFSTANTVPTGNYANIIVGPATATKFVADSGQDDLAREISELAKPVEWALGHRRDQILREISGEGEAE